MFVTYVVTFMIPKLAIPMVVLLQVQHLRISPKIGFALCVV